MVTNNLGPCGGFNITRIKINNNSAEIVEQEFYTSGMVGAKIAFQFSEEWNGLTKTAVFRTDHLQKDVLNVTNVCTIPHECLEKAGERLVVGVYGTNGNDIVIPTIYVSLGRIKQGADPSGDVSADPSLPVWAQVQEAIGNLNDLSTKAKDNLVAAINEAAQSGGGGGMSVTAADLLVTILRNGVYGTDQSNNISALATELGVTEEEEPDTPAVTLSSISAIYTGGDVAVGTAVTDLTGIVVTAHYSDGTSATVTGYTMSGTIAEGENTITVIYQGKSATFTVNGIAESTGENNGWTDGEAYAIEWTDGYSLNNTTGTEYADAGFSVSGFMPCRGASALSVSNIYTSYGIFFYDENQEFVMRTTPDDYTVPIPVPLTAYYAKVQTRTSKTATVTVTPVMLDILNESTVWKSGVHYCLEWEYGKRLESGTGVEYADTSTTRNVSKYALCMDASTVTISHKVRSLCVFYDAGKNYISEKIFSVSTNSTTVPESAVYFRYDTYGYTDNMNVTVMLV